ncbi:MAG: tRNA pseudouridine(55) synthase TruB [Chloroflexota bacterium]|nr:tRNA pseudouridine(55) synthase TruB [Chloroflexota bacterium]
MAQAPPGAAAATLDGVLVAIKPPGPTSHDLVALVRRLTGTRRVGHGGTLDPFASGVLPIFLGSATRLAEYHMADEKAYRALIAFGARSTTDDLDGELTPGPGSPPDRRSVEQALQRFRGVIEQLPPAHSAVRVAGRRAYELARQGQKPELRPRRVEIRALDVVDWHDDEERPTATLEVRCSAGTYIRALARDLGEALGCGAYLAALRRTASGPFREEEAHPVDDIRAALAEGRAADVLLPPDAGLTFPIVVLPAGELTPLARGQAVRSRAAQAVRPPPDGLVRVVDRDRHLAAIARFDGGVLHPEKVFTTGGGRP